jgi:hypothetical protein
MLPHGILSELDDERQDTFQQVINDVPRKAIPVILDAVEY